ncbi:MAG: ribose transport system substrate-binding protein [Solirubrobacteraceae bacterium]
MFATFKAKVGISRARTWALVLAVMAVSATIAACGDDSSGGASSGGGGDSKLIVATMGFPCSLNDFAKSLCAGFAAGEKQLPAGFRFEVKTGTDFADVSGYNNLIQTSVQLEPAGMIVFPGGPSAQVPVLKQACAKDVKLIIVDNPVKGLGDCQSGYIAANHRKLGEDVGKWLVEHPPASKQVGVVTLPPGQVSSNDDRVNGFKEAVESAGFKVVATVVTDLGQDKTRTQVTNMLTAHPKLGAVFSANDQMGYGTAQAVKASRNTNVKQLTIDGALDAVKRIPDGLAANAAQDPYFAGKESVLSMAKLLQGKTIPAVVDEPSLLVDETNAKQYIAKGGNR